MQNRTPLSIRGVPDSVVPPPATTSFTPAKAGKAGAGFGFLADAARRRTPSAPERDAPWTTTEIIARLEEAGTALLAMPMTGYSTQMRTTKLDMIRSALEGYGWETARGEPPKLRPAAPDSARITRMDEALGWIPLIPLDKYVLRRIVGARALVSPRTEKHLYPWRRLGTLLGADHKAIQRWHAQGIGMIVGALNER
jgi:hypothetical protein